MRQLPTVEEQEWLLDSLGALIAIRGPEHFISRPIVEPTAEYFPDPWSFDLEGVDRVTRRLVQYADLDDLEIAITPFTEDESPKDSGGVHQGRSVAGVFLGIEGNTAHFGFNTLAPGDGEYTAGIMAHEVTHAYRTRHQLVRPRVDDEEEWLTDLTTVYLGLGMLTTNNSWRYRTEGGLNYQSWFTMAAGYLPPQAFTYLLGVQVVVRNLDGRTRRRLMGHLEPNQASFMQTAIEKLEPEVETLMKRLSLPSRSRWPSPRALGDLQRPLPPFVAPEGIAAPGPSETIPINEGWPVFRQSRTRAAFFAFWFTACSALLGLGITALSGSSTAFVLCPVGLVAGWIWGRRTRFDVCSDSECRGVLPPEAAVCPGCGGQVAGRIRSEGERLEAEDAYFRSQRVARRRSGRDRTRSVDPEP